MSKKRLFLIDGNSFCYRAYYAIRSLSNSKGRPTNAVYGFVTMLNKIVKENRPDMLAVAFDLKGPTFRHRKYEEYKMHRKPMPDELVGQLPYVKKMVSAYNIPIYEVEGYEADDVLATLAKKAEGEGIETFIVTGDKDALQLVGNHIKVYNPHKEGFIFDSDRVKEAFGVGPESITDIIALAGDATDNIPGVSGIGEKTAVELITEFGSLDNIFKKLDTIKSESRKKLLRENEKAAVLSKELAILETNVPMKIDFKEMELKPPNQEQLVELFKELEFKSLLREAMPKGTLKSEYRLISDEPGFAELTSTLQKTKEFAFDFETTSEDPMLAELVGVSFSWEEGKAYYIGMCESEHRKADPGNKKMDTRRVLDHLRDIFENEDIKKIGQNIKYEYIVLAKYGIRLKGIGFDTMVASYALNPSKLNHNLDDISVEYLNHRLTTPIEELIGKGKNAITMDKVDINKVALYCCEDSDVTLRLKKILEKEIAGKGLDGLFYDVEMPLVEVLAIMEINGVAIDKEYLDELSAILDKSLKKITAHIYELAGEEFNINSPKQLSKILFEKLKLPVVKKTKTGISTDEAVLTKLARVHEMPEALLEYRELSKLKSTYVDALPGLINPQTGRVHTSFNQTVTATGRLSSSGPNLQNIPIKTEEGRKIRKAFVPGSKKNILVSADYSQIELRILAHLSEDKHLIKAFEEGRDIHSFTASLIFNVKEPDVTAEMRNAAKTVNFGIVYGMSPYGLSQGLEIEVDKAKDFIDSYFERYPGVKSYLEAEIERARRNGYVTTIFGRRRYIPEIASPDMRLRQFAERTAVNTPIQGSAADIIKVAMIAIQDKIREIKMASRMIIQVHDELVFDAANNELDAICSIVKECMENITKLKVPIEVTIEAGMNWLDMKKVEIRNGQT